MTTRLEREITVEACAGMLRHVIATADRPISQHALVSIGMYQGFKRCVGSALRLLEDDPEVQVTREEIVLYTRRVVS